MQYFDKIPKGSYELPQATEAQIKYLKILGADEDDLYEINIHEASELIEQLKGQ